MQMLFPVFFVILGYSILLFENDIHYLVNKVIDFQLNTNNIISLFFFSLAIPRVGFIGTSKIPTSYQSKFIWFITPLFLLLGIIVI